MSTTLSPDHILKELSELWVSLGKQGDEHGEGVLRACTMTLVVIAEESEDTTATEETMAALMPEHPARTILVRLSAAGGPGLQERVYAQCWMPFGQRRQICCEQIEIKATDAELGEVAPVLLPLAVPDVPVMVWCRSARVLGMEEFRGLAAMARKLVVDTTGLPDARAVLARLAEAGRGALLVGDLAWTRLTRWREMLSQVFQNREYAEKLPGISEVRVAFGGRYETLGWYMGAWIMDCLADAGVKPQLAVNGQPGPDFLRVELAGAGLGVQLARDQDRLTITVNDLRNCTNLPQLTDYLLMREELAIVRPDPVFRRTLASAARLAYPTEK